MIDVSALETLYGGQSVDIIKLSCTTLADAVPVSLETYLPFLG